MATAFENFVNTELPKRIATNESPTTPQAGDIPVFSGVGLLTESKTASEAGLATETFATNAANTAETNAKSYADSLVTSIYKFQTTYNPQTTGNFPTTANTVGGVAIKKGFTWVVSGVTGQYTFQGVTVDNGDTLLALVDNASATSAADWHITEKNLGYTPENQANKVDDLTESTSTAKYTSVKAVVDGLSGKQNTLADAITANTYGSSTQYPVITFNAKGIATGVTLQTVPTPTFTDANFSVQKNGSPSIAASWSLTALTASRVHTYPDKDIDFKTLSSIGASDGNVLSGTRNRILGGSGNTVSGTDVVLLAASGVSTTKIDWSPVVIESSDSSTGNSPLACLSTITCTKAINASLANSGSVNLTTDGAAAGTANTPRAWITGSGSGATVASTSVHEIEFDLLHGIESFGLITYGAVFGVRKVAVYTDSTGTSTASSVQTVGTDIAVGTANGTLTMSVTIDTTNNRVVPTVTLSGATTAPIYLLAQAKIKSRYSRRA